MYNFPSGTTCVPYGFKVREDGCLIQIESTTDIRRRIELGEAMIRLFEELGVTLEQQAEIAASPDPLACLKAMKLGVV